jgi:hypothetical protein
LPKGRVRRKGVAGDICNVLALERRAFRFAELQAVATVLKSLSA